MSISSSDIYMKKMIQEQNMMIANERIALAANNENQWLNANKSLFVSSRRVDFFKVLSRNSEASSTTQSSEHDPLKLANVSLKITLPVIWMDGLRNPNTIYIDKNSTRKSTTGANFFVFFEAIYQNDMNDSDGQIIDITKCNISTFSINLDATTLDTNVELNMYVWSFNNSDFKKSKAEHSKTSRVSINSHSSAQSRPYNFVKYAGLSFQLRDAVNAPYIETMKSHLSQIGLVNFMDYSNFVSVIATAYPISIKYADIHPFAVYLNESLKCYIGFKDEYLYLYNNKFSDEPITEVSFKLSDIVKCRIDSKNKQIVKIKYHSSTYAFHLQTEDIAKTLVDKIDNFLQIRDVWGPNVSDFNKTDLRSILSDIEKIPTTYMEYIDKSIDNFSNQYDMRRSLL